MRLFVGDGKAGCVGSSGESSLRKEFLGGGGEEDFAG